MTELDRLIDNYKLLRDFIIRLLREFNKYCCIVNQILEEVYFNSNLKLTNFNGQSYYINI